MSIRIKRLHRPSGRQLLVGGRPEELGQPGDEQPVLILYRGRLWLLSDRYWPGTGAVAQAVI